MKKFIILLIISGFLNSCSNPNKIYDKKYSFSQNQWKLEDKKTFKFDIKEDGIYNITFLFSHVYDYQFVKIPLTFDIKDEKNRIETLPIILNIKDKNGKELADCAGDYCDLKYPLKQNIKLKKGQHKIFVSNNFDYKYLPNVIAIGVSVEKVKKH